ncbi:Uma2 family endonuclease [Tundrisphaera sp. TA3]|uniref:Uma2 family endonuclease n=1 Tax=Tundrisphaera sp. TA3 TaxID=3435775 RepID=UPI003EBD5437
MSRTETHSPIVPGRDFDQTFPSDPGASAPEPSNVEVPARPEGVPYRFHVDDFYRMIELDFFARESRVGLWDGQVYEKMAKKYPHSASSIELLTNLSRVVTPGWCISVENPITIAPDKAPLPDLAILRGRGRDYFTRRPGVADVGLIVELADSSLKIDTGVKLAAYARAGIPAYWVVNLVANVVQVYERPIPEEGRYDVSESYAPGALIPLQLDGVAIGPIAASDLLPAP